MLSGGRVNWGAGRGFAHSEFNAFGVPPEESAERFREAVEIVLKAWTEERFTYQGAHFRFDDIEVLPKPLQRPHPPTWMAATSEPAIDWAASRGFSILMDPHSSMKELGAKRRHYTAKLAAVRAPRMRASGGRGLQAPTASNVAAQPSRAPSYPAVPRTVVQAWRMISPPALNWPTRLNTRKISRKTLASSPSVGLWKRSRSTSGTVMAPLSRDTFRLLVDKVLPRL